ILTRPAWPPRPLSDLGLRLVALAGISQIVVGVTPMGMRLAPVLAAGVSANVAILLLGLALWQTRCEGSTGGSGARLGLLGVSGSLAFGLTIGATLNLATGPGVVWLAALGSLLVANGAQPGTRRAVTSRPLRESRIRTVTGASWVAAAWAFG